MAVLSDPPRPTGDGGVAGDGRDGAAGSRSLIGSDGERVGSGGVGEAHPGGRKVGAAGDGLGHAARVDHRGHLLPARRVVEVMIIVAAGEYKRVSRDVWRAERVVERGSDSARPALGRTVVGS